MTPRRIGLYQVDAFSDRVFAGNPAAVCPLDEWLPDATMQAIAAENNLSETAFFVPRPEGYDLRWFTPTTEVDLCGHATRAAAFVIFNCLGCDKTRVYFDTETGRLEAHRDDKLIVLNIPSIPAKPCEMPTGILETLGKMPEHALEANAYLFVFRSEPQIIDLRRT